MIESHIIKFMKNEKYISNLIGTFATSVSNDIEKQIAELGGRSLSHEAALVTIYNHPNETIDVLSKVLGLTHSGAVRLINTLEKNKAQEKTQISKISLFNFNPNTISKDSLELLGFTSKQAWNTINFREKVKPFQRKPNI